MISHACVGGGHRWDARQVDAFRLFRDQKVRLRSWFYTATSRRGRADAHVGLALRRNHHRHTEPRDSRCGGRGALEPRPGLGRVRLVGGARQAGQGDERCRDAGARQRRRRPHALSRPRLRTRHGAGRRRSCRPARAGTPAVQGSDLRRSAGTTRPRRRLAKKDGGRRCSKGPSCCAAAVAAEYVVLGGGNVRLFDKLPPRFRRGHNDNAFDGGFRAWDTNGTGSGRRRLAAEVAREACATRSPARTVRQGSRSRAAFHPRRRQPPVTSTIRRT